MLVSGIQQSDSIWVLFGGGGDILHSLQDASSRPGIKPGAPALEAQSFNHWTPRECLVTHIYVYILFFRFFFFMGYYSILKIVPHAMW